MRCRTRQAGPLMLAALSLLAACTAQAPQETAVRATPEGERLFLRFCSGCHPDGGNSRYPQKTLSRMVLKANGIVTVADVVALLRNPGEGMPRFDRQTVSDAEARAIAGYVLATFP
ncbi:MAG: c-type cytochrome [Geobacter sp.]|nr:c-type cytochrome [Geobacter sp.]